MQFSNLLGCVAGLKTAVTGISLVALGTSLPDAFASRTAAKLDDTADNSIGNITGTWLNFGGNFERGCRITSSKSYFDFMVLELTVLQLFSQVARL